ncbi:unnamed protein product [Polarella glacialis]|uniref:glutathione gamma-glutamylcysteinyltransferase n=1 Tax=Polarella glacialis TaxID=89957 RepID=A0A813KTS8_POLGL|nr:unnamed protein product [Polarella glacialis]
MGCFFRLIEQFHTQDEPSFCGLGTLTMVLNAMNVDPGRTWKGPWRWFRETMLDCCEPLERIQLNGITFIPLACLARCNGAFVDTHRADESDGDLEAFRRAVCESCCEVTGCAEEEGYKPLKVLVVSYSRKQFGQTGDGHYSPIGGYHAASDKVLVLDVARFKHPPHWVPLVEMWESMRRLDPDTGLSRGFMLLSRKPGALCSSWLSLSIRDKTESGAAHPVVGSLVNLPEAFAAALTTWQGDLPRLPADGKLAAAEVLRRALAFCDSPAMPLSVVCRQPSSAASPEERPELATGEQAAANEALRQVLHALGQAGAAMDRALSPLPEVPVVLAVDNLKVALLLALDLSLWVAATLKEPVCDSKAAEKVSTIIDCIKAVAGPATQEVASLRLQRLVIRVLRLNDRYRLNNRELVERLLVERALHRGLRLILVFMFLFGLLIAGNLLETSAGSLSVHDGYTEILDLHATKEVTTLPMLKTFLQELSTASKKLQPTSRFYFDNQATQKILSGMQSFDTPLQLQVDGMSARIFFVCFLKTEQI